MDREQLLIAIESRIRAIENAAQVMDSSESQYFVNDANDLRELVGQLAGLMEEVK